MFGPRPGSDPRFVAVTVNGDGGIVSLTDPHGLLGYAGWDVEGKPLTSILAGFSWSLLGVCGIPIMAHTHDGPVISARLPFSRA